GAPGPPGGAGGGALAGGPRPRRGAGAGDAGGAGAGGGVGGVHVHEEAHATVLVHVPANVLGRPQKMPRTPSQRRRKKRSAPLSGWSGQYSCGSVPGRKYSMRTSSAGQWCVARLPVAGATGTVARAGGGTQAAGAGRAREAAFISPAHGGAASEPPAPVGQ